MRERERERQRTHRESIATPATLKARRLTINSPPSSATCASNRSHRAPQTKRRTILSRLERISRGLRALDDSDLLPREHDSHSSPCAPDHRAVADRPRPHRPPAVTDEVHRPYFVVHLLGSSPAHLRRPRCPLAEHYPASNRRRAGWGWLSWIGGDRDSNPNVCRSHRRNIACIVTRHHRSLHDLARRLGCQRAAFAPPELLAESTAALPHIASKNVTPPNLPPPLSFSPPISRRIERRHGGALLSAPHHPPHTEAFAQPTSVARAVPRRLAAGTLRDVRRQFDIFGFHAARPAVREESVRLAAAPGEILRGLKINFDFEEGTDRARTATLRQLFSAATPSLAPRPGVTAETAETWALFQLLARAREVYGRDLLGPFIISMTRGPADVLTVLARALVRLKRLQIVPFGAIDLDAPAHPGRTLLMTSTARILPLAAANG